MNCCWPDNTPIIQGDVNITSYNSKSTAAYYMDIPALRKGDNSTAYFSQAGVTYSHYYIVPFINSDETHNRIVVCDLSTRTVSAVYDDKYPTGFHFNGGARISTDGDYATILYAGLDNKLLYMSTAGGALLTAEKRMFTCDRVCHAVAYNEATKTIYGRQGFEFFTINLNFNTLTATTTPLFDLSEDLQRYYYTGYDILTTQGFCYHDGIFYVAAAWPGSILKISENGMFLGAESIPQCVDGRPCGELESVQWSAQTQSFILNAIGRGRATYTDLTFTDQWMFSYIFQWGEKVLPNNRRMYTSGDGKTGVSVVGYNTTVYAQPAYGLDSGEFNVLGNAYHDGTTEHPFPFVSEAVYYSEWCQANTNRLDVDLIVSGDYTGIEDTIVVTTLSKLSFNGATFARVAVNNTAATTIIPQSGTTNKIGTLLMYGGSRAFVRVPCQTVSMLEGAELTANALGTCTISTTGENLLRLGGTGQTITLQAQGSTLAFVPSTFSFASGSTFGVESKIIKGGGDL